MIHTHIEDGSQEATAPSSLMLSSPHRGLLHKHGSLGLLLGGPEATPSKPD